jgi:hypothetical protein
LAGIRLSIQSITLRQEMKPIENLRKTAGIYSKKRFANIIA